MPLLRPRYYIHRITEITPAFLQARGLRGLVLDVDNTLTTHDHPYPMPDIARWLEEMRRAGVAMMIVSNNSPQRVEPFAAILQLPFVADGAKPLTKGIAQAARQMGLAPRELAMVGDQIFTDILGGNLFGAASILVEPLGAETVPFIKFKRQLEKLVLLGCKPKSLEVQE